MTADLKALCEETLRLDAAATPEPWECWEEHAEVHAGVSVNEPGRIKSKYGRVAECDPYDLNDYDDDGLFDAEERAEANSDLIAHYRTAAPALARALLSALERQAELERRARELVAVLPWKRGEHAIADALAELLGEEPSE